MLLYHITCAVQCVLTYITCNSQRRVTVTSGRRGHIRQNFILAPYYISIKGFSQIRIRTPKHLIIMKGWFDPPHFPQQLTAMNYVSCSWKLFLKHWFLSKVILQGDGFRISFISHLLLLTTFENSISFITKQSHNTHTVESLRNIFGAFKISYEIIFGAEWVCLEWSHSVVFGVCAFQYKCNKSSNFYSFTANVFSIPDTK